MFTSPRHAPALSYGTVPCGQKALMRRRWCPMRHLRSQLRQKDRSQKPRASSVRQRNKGGTKIDACGQARSGRERAYAKAELKSDFAMSSFWDNKVHEACW